MLRIGCHLSASKGYLDMAKTAVSIGANTFQYFSRNPRGGSAKAFDVNDADSFIAYASEHGIDRILTHAPYTLNACAEKAETLDFARRVLKEDIERLEYFSGALYNFHPGSHVGQGIEVGIAKIVDSLNGAMFPGMKTTVLLETMAGKGSEVGGRFEELRDIITGIEVGDRIGVCLDTCHVFDAGYDIRNDLESVLDEFDRVIGIGYLRALHINDSKNPFFSHKDRHEKLGEGSLGLETFRNIIKSPVLSELPMFLETPNELDGYASEIQTLKQMV